MFQIQVRGESGEWLALDEPYKHADAAVTDAIALGQKYDADGHLRVTTVEP